MGDSVSLDHVAHESVTELAGDHHQDLTCAPDGQRLSATRLPGGRRSAPFGAANGRRLKGSKTEIADGICC